MEVIVEKVQGGGAKNVDHVTKSAREIPHKIAALFRTARN